MDRLLSEHALDPADQGRLAAVLDAPSVFWVTGRTAPEELVADCADAAGLPVQCSVVGGRLRLTRDGRVVEAEVAGGSRHATLLALNRLLAPDFEVRLMLASVGADTLAFVVLPAADWAVLDSDMGDALAQVTWPLTHDLDPFDRLQQVDVLGAYLDVLQASPGRYGEALAHALSRPGPGKPGQDEQDGPLLPW